MDAHIERSLARLVSEQTRLLRKATRLTDAEKSAFRARAKKISLLMRRTRNEHKAFGRTPAGPVVGQLPCDEIA